MDPTESQAVPAAQVGLEGSQISLDGECEIVEPVCPVWPDMEDPDFEWTSSPVNPYASRRFNKNADGSRGDLSGYIPHLKNISDATLRQLPQFLFRVTHAASYGTNDVGAYRSYAVSKLGEDSRVDFFSLSDTERRRQVDDHVSQVNFESHWISFTDCPLSAKGRAMQHVQQGHKDVEIHIIDTEKIKEPAIIVYSYAMLRAHRVCIDLHPVEQKKLLGSSYAEFLAWDALDVEASVVRMHDLLYPKSVSSDVHIQGFLELVPEFIRHNSKKKDLQFRQASELKTLLYGLEERLEMEKDMCRPRGPRHDRHDTSRASWQGAPDHLKSKATQDPRCELDEHNLNKYMRLVEKVPAHLKMIMLTCMLSLKTSYFHQDSIIRKLASLAQDDAEFGMPECHVTNLRTAQKPGVEIFQLILADSFQKAFPDKQVKYGMLDVQRNIVRLDTRQVMSPGTAYQKAVRVQLQPRPPLPIMRLQAQPSKNKKKRASSMAADVDDDMLCKKVCVEDIAETASIAVITGNATAVTNVVRKRGKLVKSAITSAVL